MEGDSMARTENLPEITLLGGRVRLFQPLSGFKTSMDSVMLAASCPAQPGERVLDMGAGVGGAGFCLLARIDNVLVTGVELQKEYCEIANKNRRVNKYTDRIEFIKTDVRDYHIKDQPLRFDHVICNPPYFEDGHYTPSPDKVLAQARGNHAVKKAADGEGKVLTLSGWIDAGYRLLKEGGSFTIIHKAEKTDVILKTMQGRYGDIEIIPLWPKMGQDAKRVIVRGRRNSKGVCILRAGIVMHDENGKNSAEANRILRAGHALL